MVSFFDIVTIIISTFFFIKAIKKIGTSSRYIIYAFFFVITIIPLYLDYIVGFPNYTAWKLGSKNYGFILSYNDELTRIVYDLFLLLSQSIILFYKNDKENEKLKDKNVSSLQLSPKAKKILYYFLIFFAVLPIILVLILPINNSILYTLEWREMKLFGVADSRIYYHVEKLSYIGVISSLILLLSKPKYFLNTSKKSEFLMNSIKPMWLLFTFFNICIESKRSIIIFCLAIFVTYLIETIPRKKMPIVIIISSVFLATIVFLGIYIKTTFRSYTNSDAIYTALRIDYFRDDTIKMLIYSIFNKGINVLDYPFQSYIMQLGYLFPLDLLGVTRLGYNTYFTCALLNVPLSTGLSYTTTSFYDELFANFGLLGGLIAPLISVYIAKLADKQTTILKIFILACYFLMAMYSLNYIMWFLQATMILIFFANKKIYYKK